MLYFLSVLLCYIFSPCRYVIFSLRAFMLYFLSVPLCYIFSPCFYVIFSLHAFMLNISPCFYVIFSLHAFMLYFLSMLLCYISSPCFYVILWSICKYTSALFRYYFTMNRLMFCEPCSLQHAWLQYLTLFAAYMCTRIVIHWKSLLHLCNGVQYAICYSTMFFDSKVLWLWQTANIEVKILEIEGR